MGLSFFVLAAASSFLSGCTWPLGPGAWRALACWVALTSGAALLAGLNRPLIAAAQHRGWLLRPGGRTWALYGGLVVTTCLVAGAMRSWLGVHLMPEGLAPGRAIEFALNAGTGFSLIVLISGWYQGQVDHRAATARQREQLVKELMRLQRQLVSEDEDMRQAVAEILHGRVQSYLLLAWLRLREAGAEPAARDEVSHLLAQVHEASLQASRAALQLSPPASLRAGLEALAARFRHAHPVELVWPAELDELASRLDPEAHQTIVQLVEECLLNAVRHAAPRQLYVIGSRAGATRLQLAVRDDGRGLAVVTAPGQGFRMLRRKLELLGGSARIDPGPQGTEVTFALEVPERDG